MEKPLQGPCPKHIKVESSDTLTRVWCASVTDNLSQQDTKGPDIRLNGERSIVDGLRGCPFDREFGSCFLWNIEKQSKFELMLTLLLRH